MDYNNNDTTENRKNKHLNYDERMIIQIRLKDGLSRYKIAKELGRPINTISNEIERGTVKQKKQNKEIEIYYADSGRRVYETNRKNCGKRPKLVKCRKFIREVQQRMKTKNQSIDAVIGNLIVENKYDKSQRVCTKTFYNYVDSGILETKNIDLPLKVKRNNKARKNKENKRVLGTSIDERPEYIAFRNEFGHWEIDTVIGLKSYLDSTLLTLLERKTRQLIVIKMANKTADSVTIAMNDLKEYFGDKFDEVFKSITSDNGSEFSDLHKLEENSQTKVYYSHPYSSFERGSNERHNGLIRRFIKKGKAINNYSIDFIAYVEDWCNTLPRKILKYKTPEELFEAELDLIYST